MALESYKNRLFFLFKDRDCTSFLCKWAILMFYEILCRNVSNCMKMISKLIYKDTMIKMEIIDSCNTRLEGLYKMLRYPSE